MLQNVVPTLGGKMTIMETLFADLRYSIDSFRPIGQHTSKIHKKIHTLSKKYNSNFFLHFSHLFGMEKKSEFYC